MLLKLVIGCCLVWQTYSLPTEVTLSPDIREEVTTDGQTPTQYSFKYFVRDESTGDIKAQEERREGDEVKGSYTVAEPNGDLRTVTYTAGKGRGFEAVVDVQKGRSPMMNLNKKDPPAPPQSGYFVEMMSPVETYKARELNPSFTDVFNLHTGFDPRYNEYTVFREDQSRTHRNIEPSTTVKDEEVEKEVKAVMDTLPKTSQMNILNIPFHKDKEEAIIEERITEVARQLAEASLRQEFEERKLAHLMPIQIQDKKNERQEFAKAYEFPAKSLPLVARLPAEMSQLQLITEVQTVPQHVYREGFYPITPAPELSGPLLGGPPLKTSVATVLPTTQAGEEPGSNLLAAERETTSPKPKSKSMKYWKKPLIRWVPQGKALTFPVYETSNHVSQAPRNTGIPTSNYFSVRQPEIPQKTRFYLIYKQKQPQIQNA